MEGTNMTGRRAGGVVYSIGHEKTFKGHGVCVLRFEGGDVTTVAAAEARTLKAALLLARVRASHEIRSWRGA